MRKVPPGTRLIPSALTGSVARRELGAEVYGLDASEALLEIARRRVPDADVRLGDVGSRPFESDFFDLVAGFNSFFFAADISLPSGRRGAWPTPARLS